MLDKIQVDLKEALKARDELKVSTLRLLLAAIHNKEIALRLPQGQSLPEEEILQVVRQQVKERRESIEAYRAGGRNDLAQKEEVELAILNTYLPQELSAQQIEEIARQTIKELLGEQTPTVTDFGRIMGAVMGKLKGRADGALVSEVVKKILNQG